MNQIITINKTNINGTEENSVNSRDIYEYLELAEGKHNRWIESCIEKYDFIKDIDYISADIDVRGKTTPNLIVSMDMAKELCMVSNTVKGKETRKYFIAIEKEASKPKIRTLEDIVHESALLVQAKVIELESKIKKLEAVNEKMIEDVVELIEINTIAETKPLPRYHAVGFYQGRYGMSNQKTKEMIGAFSPKACRCSKNVEGLVSEYQAYFISDMDDAFSDVKASAKKVSKRRYVCPYLKGPFAMN